MAAAPPTPEGSIKVTSPKPGFGDGLTPYMDIIPLHLDNVRVAHVHYFVLEKLRDSSGAPLWYENSKGAFVQDVAKTAGHTLVHFLYTGMWQLPKSSYMNGIASSRTLEVALDVFAAAETLGLEELGKFARAEITDLDSTLIPSAHLTLHLILQAFRRFQGRPSEWTIKVIQEHLNKGSQESPSAFFQNWFIQDIIHGEADECNPFIREIVLRTSLHVLHDLTVKQSRLDELSSLARTSRNLLAEQSGSKKRMMIISAGLEARLDDMIDIIKDMISTHDVQLHRPSLLEEYPDP